MPDQEQQMLDVIDDLYGIGVRDRAYEAIHGRTVADRAEGLADLLDTLGVLGPKN